MQRRGQAKSNEGTYDNANFFPGMVEMNRLEYESVIWAPRHGATSAIRH
jgi:hypothetical protein